MHTHTHTPTVAGIQTSAAAAKLPGPTIHDQQWKWCATANRPSNKKKMEREQLQLGSQAELMAADYIIINLQATNEHTACVCLCVETEHIIVTYLNLWKWIIT